MKDENLNINNSQINNNINDTSTNQSSSYEMESFGIENPLLFSDYKRKDSTDVLKLKLTEEENNKKIVYPSNILSSLPIRQTPAAGLPAFTGQTHCLTAGISLP